MLIVMYLGFLMRKGRGPLRSAAGRGLPSPQSSQHFRRFSNNDLIFDHTLTKSQTFFNLKLLTICSVIRLNFQPLSECSFYFSSQQPLVHWSLALVRNVTSVFTEVTRQNALRMSKELGFRAAFTRHSFRARHSAFTRQNRLKCFAYFFLERRDLVVRPNV